MLHSLTTRWLGVGLAASLAVVTIALAATDRLALYINPESAWFAVGMAVIVLIGTVASFALPLGGEEDHGHDHGTRPADAAEHPAEPAHTPRRVATVMTATGGVLASGVVVTMLVAPPASLSAELAMSRDVGAAPLFAGTDVVTLAASGDTARFGVGEWAGVFASATDPDRFDGDPVTLTGFVTPGGDGDFALSRLVITHCVIDAQSASLPVTASTPPPGTGEWVSISGTVRADADGSLRIHAEQVTPIDEPQDPYEY
ncbi:TIGR03943 family protein [Microbacterium lushaniae]|uniref:TIGR03943 family protein n=1 Tax=Microbacterium lushaniae TaxID=2614639 RepID=A0A5J6L918_9MICO|nr:TIGR03943 family protein [Microbacterium lushaniae]